MALKFDFRLVVLATLFLLGAWASQATARTLEETSMFERHGRAYKAGHVNKVKPFKSFKANVKLKYRPRKGQLNDYNDAGTETPGVNSSPGTPTKNTTPGSANSLPNPNPASIFDSVDKINNAVQTTDTIAQNQSGNCGM